MTYLSAEMDGLALAPAREGAGEASAKGGAAGRGYALVTLSVVCVFALLGLGIVMLYSVTEVGGSMARVQRQALYALAGIVGLVVALRIPYRRLCKASPWLYAPTVGILLLVLVAGTERNGATRWFAAGPITVQPSEFARLVLIGVLAWYLPREQRWLHKLGGGLVVPLGLIGLPCGLVLAQPDFGMAALLGGMGGTILFIGGCRVGRLALVAAVAAAGFFLLVRFDEVRWRRVQTYLGMGEAEEEDAQTKFAASALRAGGRWGRGLGRGFHKYKYLPEADNDFIFPIIGEELGLPATLGIVSAFFLLTAGGTIVALRACDLMGLLLAAGLTFNLSAQALLNMAVVTRLLPNKGLPLPFISAGGSNLIMHLIGIGVLLNIYVTSRRRTARTPAAAEAAEDW